MNIYIERTRNLAPDRTKKREFVVTREKRQFNKVTIINKSFSTKAAAQNEIVRAFGEMGAWV